MWSSVSVADGKALVDEHANITAPAVAPETP
jgi:hypothetical protein